MTRDAAQDVAEQAVLDVPAQVIAAILLEYANDRESANRLDWLRARLAIEVRRAVGKHDPNLPQ